MQDCSVEQSRPLLICEERSPSLSMTLHAWVDLWYFITDLQKVRCLCLKKLFFKTLLFRHYWSWLYEDDLPVYSHSVLGCTDSRLEAKFFKSKYVLYGVKPVLLTIPIQLQIEIKLFSFTQRSFWLTLTWKYTTNYALSLVSCGSYGMHQFSAFEGSVLQHLKASIRAYMLHLSNSVLAWYRHRLATLACILAWHRFCNSIIVWHWSAQNYSVTVPLWNELEWILIQWFFCALSLWMSFRPMIIIIYIGAI